MNATRNAAIVSAYRAGKSAASVGRNFGLTESRVLQILKEWGEPRRKHKPTVYLDLRRKAS